VLRVKGGGGRHNLDSGRETHLEFLGVLLEAV
jgi:hypothetical protein